VPLIPLSDQVRVFCESDLHISCETLEKLTEINTIFELKKAMVFLLSFRFHGCCLKPEIIIFEWKVTLKYASSPFKQFNTDFILWETAGRGLHIIAIEF